MAEGTLIKPDMNFIRRVMNSGGESLKKCYQCATCSVVCNMTPDDSPFPRKEMVHAQWGLRDKLIANPDIWLCHQCSDCTAYCPRGAKPGEVLGAVRKLSIEHYAFPSFMGRLVGDPKYLLALLAVPVVLFLLVIGYLGHLGIPEGPIVYSKFMPIEAIDIIFTLSALFAVLGFFAGVVRYWGDLKSGVEISKNKWQKKVKGPLPIIVLHTIVEFLTHKRFRKCDLTRDRANSHLLVFLGFVGLAVTTAWAVFYLYVMHWDSPYPMVDPLKIFANVSAASLLIGILWVISNRTRNAEKAGNGSYYDWLFIGIVTAIVVSGLLSELLRLLNIAALAYPVYFIHLVVIFTLFAYAPYSKMAHMVYRTTALAFSKYSGREDKKYD